MIGMLNRSGLLRGLQLYGHHKLGSSLRRNLPWNSTSLIKPIPGTRSMAKLLKPPSQKSKKLQTTDGIPLSYDVIYNSFEYHTISQHLSAAMSGIFIILSSKQIIFNFEDTFPDLFTGALNVWLGGLFLYLNLGTAIISYKSPVRIYHNRETGDYKAIFNAFKPTDIRVLEFKKGMVNQIPPPDNFTLFRYHRYMIKDQDLYMFDIYFRYPADLYNMFNEIEEEEEEEEEEVEKK